MSGRIRTIKPELLEDAVTARLSSVAFRTFIALIVLADDYGNFRAEPRFLEGHIFWSTTPERPLEEVLQELESGRLVLFYVVRGQRYGSIRTWSKNQKVQKLGQPHVPGPDEADGSERPIRNRASAQTSSSLERAPCAMDSRESPEGRQLSLPSPLESLRTDLDLDLDLDLDQRPTTDATSAAPESTDSDRAAQGTSVDEVNASEGSAQDRPALMSRAGTPPSMLEDGPPSKGLEREVFEHWLAGWRRVIGGTRAPALDAKRRRKIRARLADQFTLADLKRAIDGLWASSWHIENGRTDIELVCRDASHVERFMGLLAPTSALPFVNEASSPAPVDDAFVPPPAKLFEVMESVRRAFSPPDDSSGAPTIWKARPRPDAEATNRGAHVG